MKEKTSINIMFMFFFLICISFLAAVTAFAGINDKSIFELRQIDETLEKTETVERPKVEYTASKIKDPFQTNIVKNVISNVSKPEDVTPPSIEIQGIIWGGKVPQAIIENTVVKAGDTVKEDVRILNISKEGVTVFYNNQRFMLSSPATINLQKLEEKRRH